MQFFPSLLNLNYCISQSIRVWYANSRIGMEDEEMKSMVAQRNSRVENEPLRWKTYPSPVPGQSKFW